MLKNTENNLIIDISNIKSGIIQPLNPGYLIFRICSVCGKDEITNKFKPKGKKCIKCYSKSNNEKHREKDYFKKYYQDSKLAKLNNEMVV
jgi:hypothetical protein